MCRIFSLLLVAGLVLGCATMTPSEQDDATMSANLDFGDFSSQTLTTRAWEALAAGNYLGAVKYTEKCAELYEAEARKMQASMSARAPRDKVHDYWALNDVGTSYFIMGEALTKMRRYPEALAAFKVVRDELKYAQTWDPKGWFWSPAEAAYPKVDWLQLKIDKEF